MKSNKQVENIEIIEDLEITNKEVLLERGYYKISYEDNFALLKLNENTWYRDLNKFVLDRYSEINYKIKKVDYIIDDRNVKENV